MTRAKAALLTADAYLVAIVAASVAASRRRPPTPRVRPEARQIVFVPAHDEETMIATTVRSLLACEYPEPLREVIVIADNCTDGTARVAADAGATVWERRNPERRGKGHAVAWALEQLASRAAACDVVVLVDADCTVSANLLRVIDARMAAGARVVQVRYDVGDPAASPSTALRWAGVALMNTVRPLGRTAVGLSAGLFGTGMAFAPAVLASVPWSAFSLAEDAELHLHLVASGERVDFAPEASVWSPMPTERRAAEVQQLRWEAGRWQMLQLSVPKLVRAAVERGDARSAAAAAELVLVPPQSLLAIGNLSAVALAVVRRRHRTSAIAGALGQAVYVVGGLAVARAPAPVWRALGGAAPLVVRRAALQLRALVRPPQQWERTTRSES